MVNEAHFSVTGYVATQPQLRELRDGTAALTFRLGWTPRVIDRTTGEWSDTSSSFVSVTCFRKVAENAGRSLRRGDPVVLKGTLRVREWTDRAGTKRPAVEVSADFLGHDLAKGTTIFTKQARHTERTAEEYQRLQAEAARREPLPGDVDAARQSQGDQADAGGVPRAGAEDFAAARGELRPTEPTQSADQDYPDASTEAEADDFDEHAAMAELDSQDGEPQPEPAAALT